MQIFNDDCLAVLSTLADNSIDSLVTDPPASISFMGKEWDSDKGGREAWVSWLASVFRECLRVLKPGAHGLVWAIPRRAHWSMLALEDSGFEIRDVVLYLHGQGFPKSVDISKAIDKQAGAEREVVGPNPYASRDPYGKQSNTSLFTDDAWEGKPGSERPITAPATPEAKLWNGWGTALKPACEFWILCRKPLSEKTIAANVLRWGTGAINIDDCRIGTEQRINPRAGNKPGGNSLVMSFFGMPTDAPARVAVGRFPSNVILDDEAGAMLDEQSGLAKAKPAREGKRGGRGFGQFDHEKSAATNGVWPGDVGGGASRFFYCAKASQKERNAGLEELPAKPLGQSNQAIAEIKKGNLDFQGPTGLGKVKLVKNSHPTVKPIALMSYLCRLITPPSGIVLDPFMGSGSTGVAALGLGFDFLGIEKDGGYFEIAKARIESNQLCPK